MVAASLLAYLSYGEVEDLTREIQRDTLPDTTRSARLARASGELVAVAPTLSLAETRDALDARAGALRRRMDRVLALARAFAADRSDAGDIVTAAHSMTESLEQLVEVHGRRLKLAAAQSTDLDRLAARDRRLHAALPAPRAQGTVQDRLALARALAHWSRSLVLVERIAHARRQADLRELRTELRATLDRLHDSVTMIAAATHRAPLTDAQEDLRRHLYGTDGLLARRGAHLAARRESAGLLQKSHRAERKLNRLVEARLDAARASMAGQIAAVIDRIGVFRIALGVIVGTGVVFIALFGWGYIARRVVDPLVGLTEVVRRVGQGDLDVRATVAGRDEIAELETSINRMIEARRQAEWEVREAKDTAELANRAKSEFLANMSHELRTPLNAIIGFSDMLQAETFGGLSRRNKEFAKDIHDSGVHLLDIINDLLDVSKIEAGGMELQDEHLALAPVVERCLGMLTERANVKNIALEMEIPEALPHLRADDLRVKQILLNLLSNSVKFTPENGRVRVEAQVDAEGRVQLAVVDSGRGIAAADLETVLRPFGQAQAGNLSRDHQGTGLGLTLVQSLTALHGGWFTLDSVEGEGTRATVIFPVERTLHAVTA